VDKHFNDNWVFPLYMGVAFDLSEEWAGYKAAREALAMDCLQVRHLVYRSFPGVPSHSLSVSPCVAVSLCVTVRLCACVCVCLSVCFGLLAAPALS
jgi:hypothetical protein